MKFVAGKEYVMRDGHRARIFISDNSSKYPLLGAISGYLDGDRWAFSLWNKDGRRHFHEESELDLISPVASFLVPAFPIRQLITELREKPWHLDPAKVAERLERMLDE